MDDVGGVVYLSRMRFDISVVYFLSAVCIDSSDRLIGSVILVLVR